MWMFPQELSFHLAAPDFETGLWYREFGNVYATPHFDRFMVLLAFLLDNSDLYESSNEEGYF